MFPASNIPGLTLTGDSVTGPGVATVMIQSKPASVIGDLVAGSVCTGAVSMGSGTVIISMRPAARVTSQVTGVNTVTGVPLTTAISPPGVPTVIIGG